MRWKSGFFVGLLTLLSLTMACAQRRSTNIEGRWDITVQAGGETYPSWLEVKRSGATLVGSFVGRFGSARPVSRVNFKDGKMNFTVPPQFEFRPAGVDLEFEGTVNGDRLEGTTKDERNRTLNWTGVRAPSLKRETAPQWGEPMRLFNGKDMEGWQPRDPNRPNGWVVKDGHLLNAKPGNDIMTTQKFTDFKLHVEFRYPKGSNSGVYLRGRYEVQIEDDYGTEPEEHGIGGVYGYLKPILNMAKKPGEWQSYDITLVGRRITLVFNGERVLDRQEIPGITGGAIDSNEAEPGPLFFQGDHGPVELRNIILTQPR